jgi:hypothetical protein
MEAETVSDTLEIRLLCIQQSCLQMSLPNHPTILLSVTCLIRKQQREKFNEESGIVSDAAVKIYFSSVVLPFDLTDYAGIVGTKIM